MEPTTRSTSRAAGDWCRAKINRCYRLSVPLILSGDGRTAAHSLRKSTNYPERKKTTSVLPMNLKPVIVALIPR